MTMKIAVAGASGRMGRMLIEAALNSPDAELAGALDVAGSPAIGRDAADFLGRSSGVRVSADFGQALDGATHLIDFTRPEGTLEHLRHCEARGVKMVIGTTGFDQEGKSRIQAASASIAIVFAPNMSVGVNATLKLLEVAAGILNTGYDIEIIEAHHRHKVDAPSGTALLLGHAAAKGRDTALEKHWVKSRDGHTGPREDGTIGFATLRGGTVVGEHSVIFAGMGERIVLSHTAEDRTIFAHGALSAAKWGHGQKPGMYAMTDVLGL